MSRTDAHRPYLVQQADPLSRWLFYWFARYPSHGVELISWKNLCGCKRCTDQNWRKLSHRRDRAWRRKHRQLILKNPADCREEIDLRPRRAWY